MGAGACHERPLRTALLSWLVGCARVAELAARANEGRLTARVRTELATVAEIEAQLALAQDAEEAVRAQWLQERVQRESERAQWQARQEQELAAQRSAIEEVEAQLTLAHDSEEAARAQRRQERAQWESERARWHDERARWEFT